MPEKLETLELFKVTADNAFVLLGTYELNDGFMDYRIYNNMIMNCDCWISGDDNPTGKDLIPTITVNFKFPEESEDEFSVIISQPKFFTRDVNLLDIDRCHNIVNNIQAILSMYEEDEEDYPAGLLLHRLVTEKFMFSVSESFFVWEVEDGMLTPGFELGSYKDF